MAAFGIFAIAGTGMGPVVAGWTEQNPRFEWRWIQWFHVMYEILPISEKDREDAENFSPSSV